MKTREKLSLTKDEALDILDGSNEKFETIKDRIVENSRWTILHEIIIKRKSDNKFFKDSYGVGATEMQDESPWEYNNPNFTEVFPVEKTIIVFE